MMIVFVLQSAFDFNAIHMRMASYAMMAMMLMVSVCAFYLIIRQRTIILTDLLTLIFLVIIAASSLFHGTDFVHWVYISFSICLLRFFFNFYQDRLSPLIIGMTIGFSIAAMIQLYQLITNPDMWIIREDNADTGYILGGNYNQIGVRLLIMMILNILCIKINRKFIFLLIPCVVISIIMPLMVGSMTSAAGIILFFLLCLIPSMRLRRLSIYTMLTAIALFQIFVCFNGKGIENNELMVWFIEDVLGKNITFTGRTHMWDSALRIIVQSPLWGYGYPDRDWYLLNMTNFAVGPHNVLLTLLIFGGIPAMMLYLYFLFTSIFRTLRIRDYCADCIIIGISVLCMMMLMEFYPMPIVFSFLILAEYYPQLHRQLAEKAQTSTNIKPYNQHETS
ncbi:MAG: O-antigen ligase family protein [Bacteroidaceae bacterium]|nr:O-antigen ligase family protein [Bacteroidaceae bacterium]